MGTSQTNSSWDVLLDLDADAVGPLHDRLKRALRRLISDGILAEGSVLPPSRQLALDLGVARSTVTEAYAQLAAEGYLQGRPGAGTSVRWTRDRSPAPVAQGRTTEPAPRYDMTPGLPDLRAFPRTQWVKALASQGAALAVADLGYPPSAGHPRLRGLLADYLNRARGANVTADGVVVCASVTEAVRRIGLELAARGVTRIAFEEPGWGRLRQVAASVGLTPVPIPVDGDGLRVDLLEQDPLARAVVVTPAHQYPVGSVLAPRRRSALLQWARRVDGIIVEDDYDAEFRYDRRPLGTLQGMDSDRVLLLKSLSKMLSPALGIGWIAAPADWVGPLSSDRTAAASPPVLNQLAFADYLASGGYDRHLRAVRRRYLGRRDRLVGLLAEHLPGLTVTGVSAGLHLVLSLPPGTDVAQVVSRALDRSVRVSSLASAFHHPDNAPPGLIIGYGNLADTAVEEAVRRLAAAYSD